MEISEDFRKSLIWSGGAHFVLFLFMTVRAIFFPGEPLRLENAVRVDIVGLPDKIAQPPPELSKPLEPSAPEPRVETPPAESEKKALPIKETPPQKETVVLKPKKPTNPKEARKNQESALKRLEAMARLERQSRAEAAAKAIASASKQVKGNEISHGSSLTGLTRLDHDRYLDQLESRIRAQWSPPKFLAKAGLRVRVVLFIKADGTISDHRIIQSSGNSVFDESAIAAVNSAQPFTAPPDSLRSMLAQQGVELDLEPSGYR